MRSKEQIKKTAIGQTRDGQTGFRNATDLTVSGLTGFRNATGLTVSGLTDATVTQNLCSKD